MAVAMNTQLNPSRSFREYQCTYPDLIKKQGVTSANIQLTKDEENHLSVTIKTSRLILRNLQSTSEDYANYIQIYGNPLVMKTFATGQTKTPEEMMKRIQNIWLKRWNQNDPYAALSVFTQQPEKFIGVAILGHSDKPKESEIAFLLLPEFWNQKYATEAVSALIFAYSSVTRAEHFSMDGGPLEQIIATSRVDNLYSNKIFENLGMTLYKKDEKFGGLRNHYIIKMEDIRRQVELQTLVQ